MLRRIVVLIAMLGLLLVSVSSALAANEPVAGCSEGFELMTVKEVLRTIVTPGSEEAVIAGDVNNDGYICVKIIPNEGGPPQFDPAFAFVDNTVRK